MQAIPKLPMPILAAAASLEPETPALTTKLEGEEIQALPASGRRWQDFVLDSPATEKQT
jgi:hypothetical protein